jgi:hypothetical protein
MVIVLETAEKEYSSSIDIQIRHQGEREIEGMMATQIQRAS